MKGGPEGLWCIVQIAIGVANGRAGRAALQLGQQCRLRLQRRPETVAKHLHGSNLLVGRVVLCERAVELRDTQQPEAENQQGCEHRDQRHAVLRERLRPTTRLTRRRVQWDGHMMGSVLFHYELVLEWSKTNPDSSTCKCQV